MQEELTISYSGFIHYWHFYYPFGMNFDGVNPSTTSKENRYQYNGKELEKDYGIDLSDYGARWYDAGIGRFTSVDPLASDYSFQSPYAYAINNPILFRDIMGLGVDDIYVDEDGNYLGSDGAKTKDVRVINKQDWEDTKDTWGVKTESGTNALQENSTKLEEYEKGISIADGAWSSIESDGGKKMTPSVSNNSSETVFYKPENGVTPMPIGSGKELYTGIDGINVSGTVYKVPNEVENTIITQQKVVSLRPRDLKGWIITEAKILDFRIHYLDDWKPLKEAQ